MGWEVWMGDWFILGCHVVKSEMSFLSCLASGERCTIMMFSQLTSDV